jgi:YggT family protein
MTTILVNIIYLFIQVYTILIIASAVLSFIMDPFNPIRQTIDRFVNPLLNPIRKIMPPMGSIDFSPMVLLILLQIVGQILIGIIGSH